MDKKKLFTQAISKYLLGVILVGAVLFLSPVRRVFAFCSAVCIGGYSCLLCAFRIGSP